MSIAFRMLVVVFLMVGLALAQSVRIVREAPSTAKHGEQIRITIYATNNLNRTVDIGIIAIGGQDVIEPKQVLWKGSGDFDAARPPHLQWALHMEPKETKSVYYVIRPKKIGTYVLASAQGEMKEGGGGLAVEGPDRIEILCNSNHACEPAFGENSLTCPQDCKSGGADAFCDRRADGVCDLDCTPGFDSDCADNYNKFVLPAALCTGLVLIGLLGGCALLLGKKKRDLKKKGNP